MSELKFICLYRTYTNTLRKMSDVRRGRLLMALMEYAFEGKEPALEGQEGIAFSMISEQILRDRERYDAVCERNRKNGTAGGRPRGSTKKKETLQVSKNPKNPVGAKKPKEKENEKESEKENEKENYIILPGGENAPAGRGERIRKPSFEELENYCLEEGMDNVDARYFYDYYETKGWLVGDYPMTDWRAAVRVWNKNSCDKARKEDKRDFSHYGC